MLTLEIGREEYYDEIEEKFIEAKPTILQLEHSLVSVSKWESKWKKVFLDSGTTRSLEESIDYVRCMTLNVVDDSIYSKINKYDLYKINQYNNDTMTATWFSNRNNANGKRSNEKITSEIIYYWMIMNNIPFECERWHLNRLLTLIRVCEIKGSKQKMMTTRDIMAQNRSLNAARRKKSRSRG